VCPEAFAAKKNSIKPSRVESCDTVQIIATPMVGIECLRNALNHLAQLSAWQHTVEENLLVLCLFSEAVSTA
jgi:hypothetical protein